MTTLPPQPALKKNNMLINGREIADTILNNLKLRVEKLHTKHGITPTLAVVKVGDDPAITSYVNQKEKTAEKIGVKVTVFPYPETITEKELLEKLQTLDDDTKIHGVILQLPIPRQLNQQKLLLAISPIKDVDGFHPVSHFYVPLAMSVVEILKKIHFQKDPFDEIPFIVWLQTCSIVIIGKGKTGGQPVIDLLKKMKINPVVIDSQTIDPDTLLKQADIIISAVGKPHILTKYTLKQHAILIGIGMHKGNDGKFYGDYDEEDIKDIAGFYTPIPKGVGPVNVAKLLENVVIAAEISLQKN